MRRVGRIVANNLSGLSLLSTSFYSFFRFTVRRVLVRLRRRDLIRECVAQFRVLGVLFAVRRLRRQCELCFSGVKTKEGLSIPLSLHTLLGPTRESAA